MMKKLLSFSALCLLVPALALGQTYVQTTMSTLNRFIYNPAAAGYNGGFNATSCFRSQWTGIDGHPTLFTLAAHAPVPKLRGGVGGYMIYDKLGPLSTLGANVSYAYKFALGGGDMAPTLSVGAQVGFLQKALNAEWKYNSSIGIDPLVPLGNYSQSVMVPNLGAGLYLSVPGEDPGDVGTPVEKAYVSLSAVDLLEPSISSLAQNPSASDARVPRSFYLMGGYRFFFNEKMSLQPNLIFKTDGISAQMDINAMMDVKPMFFGVGYRGIGAGRHSDAMYALVGANINTNFTMGYSYDFTVSALNAGRMVHSHELVVSYTIPKVEWFKRTVRDTQGLFDYDK